MGFVNDGFPIRSSHVLLWRTAYCSVRKGQLRPFGASVQASWSLARYFNVNEVVSVNVNVIAVITGGKVAVRAEG